MNSATVLQHENQLLKKLPNNGDNHMVTIHNDNTAKAIIVQVAPDEQSPLLHNSCNDTKSTSSRIHQQHYQANNNNNNDKANIIKTKSSAMGLGLIGCSTIILGYMSVMTRLCGASFPSFQILLIRSIVQSACGILSCVYFGVNPFGPRSVRPWLIIRGLVGGFAVSSSYYAITHMPFPDASVILHLNAALTTLLAAIFLNEPLHYCQGICVTLCFVGAILVTKPGFIFGSVANNYHDDIKNDYDNTELASFIALLGAFFIATSICIVRKVGKAVNFLVYANYHGIITTLICIPPLLTVQSFVWPQFASEYLMLFMSGILAFLSQCFINKGYV
ncbi:hypothetical protein INT45_008978 [Circinella minor]|uniref:EamA domain-containing protein n=1 Tax=Circinella minor TaxID=1195481 RepID=A0A8H7S830_9FUNG|nr:hypothetical protein INT45_008978 [Circinella minor]